MQSIKTIYKIGPGPSSSHTFGPMMASKYINEQYPEATNFKVTLVVEKLKLMVKKAM